MASRLFLDTLDLLNAPYLLVDGTFDMTEPGRVAFQVEVYHATADGLAAAVSAIQQKLTAAVQASSRSSGSWISLEVQWDTSDPVFYDVLRGQIFVGPDMHTGVRLDAAHRVNVDVELVTTPWARGAAVAGGTQSALLASAAQWLQADVGGDMPALVRLEIEDTSIAGVLNRIRAARRAAVSALLADYVPWVNAAALTGATDTADGTAFGGSYAARTSSSTSFVNLARATMPAGALNKGMRDLWLRVRDTGTVMGTPASFNGVEEQVATASAPARRQTAVASGTGTSLAPSWPSATLAGSLLLLATKIRNPVTPNIAQRQDQLGSGNSTTPAASWSPNTLAGSLVVMALRWTGDSSIWTPPAGWSIVSQRTNAFGATDVTVALLTIENAAAQSGSESGGSFSSAVEWSMWIGEYTNAAASGALVAYDTAHNETAGEDVSLVAQTASDQPRALYLAVAGATSTTDSIFSFSGGFTEQSDNNGLGVAQLVVETTVEQNTTVNAGPQFVSGILACFKASEAEPRSVAITPPSGYGLASIIENFNDPDEPLTTALFYQQNAGAASGAQTVTYGEAVTATARLIEYTDIAASLALIGTAEALTTSSSFLTSDNDSTRGRRAGRPIVITTGLTIGIGPTEPDDHRGTLAVAVLGAFSTSVAFSAYSSGYAEVGDTQGMAVAEAAGDVSGWSVAALASASSPGAHLLAVFRDTSPQEDAETPGELPAGSYSARLQAVDVAGNASNATATITDTLTSDGGAIDYSWVAPTGSVAYYLLSWQGPDGLVRRIAVYGLSYRLEDPDDGQLISALPATSGAVATPAQLRARIGSAGTASIDLFDLPGIALSATNVWLMRKLASGRDMPPVGPQMNGDRPDWAVEVQFASPSGLSVTVQADAFWMAAHDEPQGVVWFPGLALGTKRTWVIETHRGGRGLVAWLEDGAGNEVGQLATTGLFTLENADNIPALLLEQAAGVSNLSARVNVTVTYWPRFRWQQP